MSNYLGNVKGIPITEYCDRYKVNTQERLRLFIPLCQAIQHAHHKGIIRRDIKPSNALVILHDETPIPKIIDFGVAKALNQPLTERTLFKEQGQLIGTPEYMSPEQAEVTGLDAILYRACRRTAPCSTCIPTVVVLSTTGRRRSLRLRFVVILSIHIRQLI